MHLLGIDWLGMTPGNGHRLLLSFGFVAAVLGTGFTLRWVVGTFMGREHPGRQLRFWLRQAISMVTTVVLVLGLVSIWFSDPARLATAFGLISAGLAFALQQVVTSIAGYLVILRGNTFTVGDRISMGGVRGDVMRLGFIQTTIMEMGMAPGAGEGPGAWVHSRQFTGRIVSVTNSKIFTDPVYNYTRDYPFIWEEIAVPIRFEADAERAETVLLDAAHRHAVKPESVSAPLHEALQARFGAAAVDLRPRVYVRITPNGLDLTVRFAALSHGTRGVKDAISRDIMAGFRAAGIVIAAARTDVVAFPGRADEPPRGSAS